MSARTYWKSAWRACRSYAWGSLWMQRGSVARFAIDALDARKREPIPFMRRIRLGELCGDRNKFLNIAATSP